MDWYETLYKINGKKTRRLLLTEIGVSDTSVTQWRSGKKLPSLKHCIQIQKLTNGKIKVEDIRPEFREL